MKKNLVPLLGIAFVVAIVSTGIFYGLFVGRLKTAAVAGPSVSDVFDALLVRRGLGPAGAPTEAGCRLTSDGDGSSSRPRYLPRPHQ
jgi:hypothetical protein